MRRDISEKKFSSAIIMMKYNHGFWPQYIFDSDHLYLSYYKVWQVFLLSPTGLIKREDHHKALQKVSVLLWLTKEVILIVFFFCFNRLSAFRLACLNAIYWNALIASIILLCLLNFSGSFFSFEQQNSTEENNLKKCRSSQVFFYVRHGKWIGSKWN